ncbi:transglutaminase family protein [Amorphus orientalis]|uniref:Transglutaminase-like putative cysteine protease n=1 Tax=Amorphus orientalis TaxID=649198 RepID=A0AAE3VPT3_9HYPH|nr:transglutaminase family protein [Amorphus orientalis]MDQ0315531.1 transglutaminase-like putative cysteine protease [Amorphus orientalis]
MRISIQHHTHYRYEVPASLVIQILRLTPRAHAGQFVSDWRIEVSCDARLDQSQDPFGNVVHTFSADGPLSELSVTASGEVETEETNGVIDGAVDRLPHGIFLRDTDLTEPDRDIKEFARDSSGGNSPLEQLHTLNGAVHKAIRFNTAATTVATPAVTAFSEGHGVCQDLAHVFLGAARSLGFPSRYVGGYLFRSDGETQQEAGHAWVEAYVPDLGWVGFDPAHGISATEAHVRVATGLDYLGAAPVRGTRYGGLSETLEVAVEVKALRGGDGGIR